MARQIAVVVGIQRSGRLPSLPGAITGARDFSRWASGHGFEVVQLTDEDGKSVRAADVYEAIEKAVSAGDVQRLIVFFAGHGISKGAFADHWLLSHAPDNPNEAVNVVLSARLARRCGIPHVLIVADACRTAAQRDQAGVEGYVIFPSADIADVELDQFFAARSGDPAYEQISDDKRREAYGLFTRCLLKALTKDADRAAEPVLDGLKPLAVTARSLRNYLKQMVPKEAGRKGVKQQPDCIPGSYWPPNVIAWVDQPPRRRLRPRPRPPDAGPEIRTKTRRKETGARASKTPPRAKRHRDEGFEKEIQLAEKELLAATPRDHFETRSGLTIVGARPNDVAVAEGHEGLFEEAGQWHVRGRGGPASAVIDLGDDRYAAVALLPEFIGSVHIGKSGVDLITYRKVAYGRFGDEDPATIRLLAHLGAAARLGFHDVAVEEASGIANHFRNYKHANPTFGIFAAYAYERAGAVDQIRDMIRFFQMADQVVPYDIMLLADGRKDVGHIQVAPSFPLLTQGWAYLDPEQLDPVIREARASLLPSLWATASGPGGRALFDAIAGGELK